MKHLLRPDAFCITLFVVGVVVLFVPLMRVAGLIAVIAAVAY